MAGLSYEQKHLARELARAGYGREDVCVKLKVPTTEPWIASMVRLQSWRRAMPTEAQLQRAREKSAKALRTRQASSVYNRKASVSLPTLSILCDND